MRSPSIVSESFDVGGDWLTIPDSALLLYRPSLGCPRPGRKAMTTVLASSSYIVRIYRRMQLNNRISWLWMTVSDHALQEELTDRSTRATSRSWLDCHSSTPSSISIVWVAVPVSRTSRKQRWISSHVLPSWSIYLVSKTMHHAVHADFASTSPFRGSMSRHDEDGFQSHLRPDRRLGTANLTRRFRLVQLTGSEHTSGCSDILFP